MPESLQVGVLGASGWIGGLVVAEALERELDVVAVLRDPTRGEGLDVRATRRVANVTDRPALEAALAGCHAVVGAYRAPRETPDEMPVAAATTIAAARSAGAGRMVWLGGTGTLQVPGDGGDIVDRPEFPDQWKASTLAHREALRTFRREAGDITWTYISLPMTIEAEGERTGSYRVGADEPLVDDEGQNRISVKDLAVAIVDLLLDDETAGRRITVAY